ncbi:MBL fold metallo-hydrolase [uncultured Jannaschia sp.]|uniref:MBL fold metallo-hydrolase n=1 Tax=uncultured Jannaschia sp. TaxID=293347 RepID=UPI00262854B0|nr:MBL fold metallo-hydrolase [uncultured Jannaschia sp.]
MTVSRLARFVLCLALFPAAAMAQDRRPSHCIAIADAGGFVHKAAFGDPLDEYSVRLNYIDHAMFLIETAGGLRVATDYTGFLGRVGPPDAVTMNRAHISHWTPTPDPGIGHVLRGWSDRVGEPADHNLDLGEMLIRSVSTDIRSSAGTGREENGNSIFVFEVAGLCIGHLGHLHHEPSAEQYAALGRLDVVMAPVDGGLTVDLPTMIRTLQGLRSSVVIPMHWFGPSSLDRFVAGMEGEFDVDRRSESFLDVSLDTLPDRPTIVVLQPAYLSEAE